MESLLKTLLDSGGLGIALACSTLLNGYLLKLLRERHLEIVQDKDQRLEDYRTITNQFVTLSEQLIKSGEIQEKLAKRTLAVTERLLKILNVNDNTKK